MVFISFLWLFGVVKRSTRLDTKLNILAVVVRSVFHCTTCNSEISSASRNNTNPFLKCEISVSNELLNSFSVLGIGHWSNTLNADYKVDNYLGLSALLNRDKNKMDGWKTVTNDLVRG